MNKCSVSHSSKGSGSSIVIVVEVLMVALVVVDVMAVSAVIIEVVVMVIGSKSSGS